MLYSNSPLVILTCFIYGICHSSLIPSRSHYVRRAIDQSVLLANGQAAQKLNARFSTMSTDSACQTGDAACIAGGFYQCVGGKYVGGPCAQGSKCFAMPLLLRNGTSLGCDTEADAKTRITDTGATGGLTGADGSDSPASSKSREASSDFENTNVNGIASDSTAKDDSIDSAKSETGADNNKNATAIDSSEMTSNSSDASGLSGDNKVKTLKKAIPSGITDGHSSSSETRENMPNRDKDSTLSGDKNGDKIEKANEPNSSKDTSEEVECQDDDHQIKTV